MIASYLITSFAVTGTMLLASFFMQYPPGRLGTLCGNLLMIYLTLCAFRMARDSARENLHAVAIRPPAR